MEVNIIAKDYLEELKLMQNQYGQEDDLYPWIYMLLQMAEQNKKKDGYEGVSIRQVAGGQKAAIIKGRELISGFGVFPDIVVLDKNFETKHEDSLKNENRIYDLKANINKLYGCVEVKKLSEKLLTISGKIDFNKDSRVEYENNKTNYLCKKDGRLTPIGEIIGELLWYGKMVYTNGLEWKYLELVKCENELKGIKRITDLRKLLYNKCVETKKSQWYKEISEENWEIAVACKPLADLGEYDLGKKGIIVSKDFEKSFDELIVGLAGIDWHKTF